MRKLILLLMAILLPVSLFVMRADDYDEQPAKKIPLRFEQGTILTRSQTFSIESYYYSMVSCIQTTVCADLGIVDMTVTNCSTGEVWSSVFDSGVQSHAVLQLSGPPGFYVISYITSSGDVYEGEFIIE